MNIGASHDLLVTPLAYTVVMGRSRLGPALALALLFAAMLTLVFNRMSVVEAKAAWSEQVLESPDKIATAQETLVGAEHALEKAAEASVPDSFTGPVKESMAEVEETVRTLKPIVEYVVEKDVPESSPMANLIDPLALGSDDVEYEAVIPKDYPEQFEYYSQVEKRLAEQVSGLEDVTTNLRLETMARAD